MGRLLGTRWTVADIRRQLSKGGPTKQWRNEDEVIVPLTVAMNPDFLKALGELVGSGNNIGGGDYTPQEGEEIVELGQLDKDQYKAKIQELFSGGITP